MGLGGLNIVVLLDVGDNRGQNSPPKVLITRPKDRYFLRRRKEQKVEKSCGRPTCVTGKVVLHRHRQFIGTDRVRIPKESHGLQRDPENRQGSHGTRH